MCLFADCINSEQMEPKSLRGTERAYLHLEDKTENTQRNAFRHKPMKVSGICWWRWWVGEAEEGRQAGAQLRVRVPTRVCVFLACHPVLFLSRSPTQFVLPPPSSDTHSSRHETFISCLFLHFPQSASACAKQRKM